MVIHDFYIPDMPFAPLKTYPPLGVDADTVLTGAVALQGFQAVTRRYAQVCQTLRPVQHRQLAQGSGAERGEPGNSCASVQFFRVWASEVFDHDNDTNA